MSNISQYTRTVGAGKTFLSPTDFLINCNTNDGGDRRRKKLFGLINYPVQLTDAWHLFKMLMIFSIIASIVLYTPLINPVIDFVIYGFSWNLMFGLFYNVVLKFKR